MQKQDRSMPAKLNRRKFIERGVETIAAATVAQGVAHAEETSERTSVGSGQEGTEPRLQGSFFDLMQTNPWDAAYWTDECRSWREENWRALFLQMHQVGIDTAICGSTAFWGRPLFPGYEKTVGLPMKFGCEDPLGTCADEAERLGMKMFFGVGLRGRCSQVRDYSGMEKPWPEIWFRWNTALAEALVDRFGDRKCFGGLYIPYEIDFHSLQVELYEKWIRQYLRPTVGKVTLLASPGNIHEKHCGTAVKDLPKALERVDIDILAPQDYGGRRVAIPAAVGLARENADALARLRKGARDIGLTLWSNCELFQFERGPAGPGRGRCIGGPIKRVKEQIALQAPLVDKLICFQYQGIMNKHTELVNIGHPTADKLHQGYVAYLNEKFPGRFKA